MRKTCAHSGWALDKIFSSRSSQTAVNSILSTFLTINFDNKKVLV